MVKKTEPSASEQKAVPRRRVLLGAAVGGALLAGTKQASADSDEDDLKAEAAIRRLTVNYALGTDAIGRDDKPAGLAFYQKTFTADAEIMVAGAPSTKRIGAAAWADFVESVFRGNNYDRTQHLTGTVDVQVGHGGKATMSTYLHATHHVADNSSNSIVLGTYNDEVVRQRGQWRIAKRTLTVFSAWTETPN